MTITWKSTVVACLLCGTFAAAAGAQKTPPTDPVTVETRITRGTVAMEKLEYDVASQELMIAAADPRATEEQRLKANLLAGIANRVLERNVEARLNFHYVLTRAPNTKLPAGTSLKVRSFYALVRSEVDAEERDNRRRPQDGEQPDEQINLWLWAGVGVGIAAGALVAVGAGAITFGEVMQLQPNTSRETKDLGRLTTRISLFLLVPAAVVGTVAGATMVTMGIVE